MNILEARVALRDRALVDVLDLALRFMTSHARLYAQLALAVLLPAVAVSLALGTFAGWWLAWPFVIALAMIAEAPFTTLASRLVFEQDVRIREVVAASLRALPRVVLIRLTQALIVCAGLVFFVLPAVWPATILLFVLEVVVLERARVSTALTRAPRIVATHSSDAIMAVLLFPSLRLVAVLVADVAGRSILQDLLEIRATPSVFQVGGGPLALLGFWGFVPFLATARFLLYLNFRTRSEGWDVQTRFAALVARANARESSQPTVASTAVEGSS